MLEQTLKNLPADVAIFSAAVGDSDFKKITLMNLKLKNQKI